MLSDRDTIRFMVGQGLKKGLATVRSMRRALTEEDQERVAEGNRPRARNEQLEGHPGRAGEAFGPAILARSTRQSLGLLGELLLQRLH